MRDFEHPIFSAAAGSPLPAAFYRVFRERSLALLALLQVAFGGNGQGGASNKVGAAIVGTAKVA